MQMLGRFLVGRTRAWGLIILVLAVSGLSLYKARGVQQEDDLLAFLPKDNPDVQLFQQINQRFGGLDLALVGLQAPDVMDREFLAGLRRVTDELKDTKGLDHVLSLTNMIDFTPDQDKGGIISSLLVTDLPANPMQREALRKKVMSRDHVVGNLISRDGSAVLVYCFLAYGTDQKSMAARIQEVVRGAFPDDGPVKKYWGGGPFIATYIYNTTQADMKVLTPWAVVAIVVIMLLAFRDLLGTFLALLSTSMGIVLSLGLMATLGVKFNIVLSSMPVILFAVGSAYGIHILSRYYNLSEEHPTDEAVVLTLRSVGPTVLAAGLTTAASLLSFIWMDIGPLRSFGVFTSLGILATLVLSLTFIPAVVSITGLKRRVRSGVLVRKALARLTVFAQTRRVAVIVALGLVAALGVTFTTRVDSRFDLSTFFSPGSPPDLAERFLVKRFGGSQFVQLYVEGDMNNPEVLRGLRALGDDISLLPHVSSVLHVGDAIARVNEIMAGQRRIPDNEAQVRLLYSFLTGDPSVTQLVTRKRDRALMHVKVDSNRAADLEPLVEHMEAMTARAMPGAFVVAKLKGDKGKAATGRLRRVALLRMQAEAHLLKQTFSDETVDALDAALKDPPTTPDSKVVAVAVERFLRSEECAVEAPHGPEGEDLIPVLAAAATALGPGFSEDGLSEAIAKVVDKPVEDDLVLDLSLSVSAPLEEQWRLAAAIKRRDKLLAAAKITLPNSGEGRRLATGMTNAVLDMDLEQVLLPATVEAGAAGRLTAKVNGLPVMHRGLSHSVTTNQIKSLAFALALVLVIMTVLFRSFWSGLLVSTPTLLTLLVIYGGMGFIGVRLDIGTSMLASIILGAGVDYAVHLAAAWRAPHGYLPPRDLRAAAAFAADQSGPAIWTNAIMVCAGFFVLTLGQARPLQNVGGLTAAAMITAALATFLALPALARRPRYINKEGELETSASSEVVDAVVRRSKV